MSQLEAQGKMEFCFSDRGGKRTKDVKNYSGSQELLRNHFLRRLPSPTQKPSKKTLFIHCFIGTNRYQTCQLNNNELSNW